MTTAIRYVGRSVRLVWRLLTQLIVYVATRGWGLFRRAKPADGTSPGVRLLGQFEELEPLGITTAHVTDGQGTYLGVLKLWYCPSKRTCWREFTVAHSRLHGYLGAARLPLAPVKVANGDAIALVREYALREVEGILQRKLLPEQLQSTAPAKAPLLGSAPPADPVAVAPRSDALHGPRRGATQQSVKAASAVPSAQPRVQQRDEGIFLKAGKDDRTLPDDQHPGREKVVRMWFIDLELTNGDNPGQIKRIWGADLERWINQIDPQRGEHLRVEHLGRVKVGPEPEQGRRAARMNLYRVERTGRT